MDEKIIKEFTDIINSFETILYALKWQSENNNILTYDSIIGSYDCNLKKLKICCFNNIGWCDD